MTDDPNQHDGPELPPSLAEELRREYRPEIVAPAGLDAEILARARSRFARRRRLRLALGLAAPLAAAASIALVVWLGWPGKAGRPVNAPAVAAASIQDIDRNGRVNILDAFLLARRMETGDAPGGDINGDGRVDRADVETIARSAVRLERGSLQ